MLLQRALLPELCGAYVLVANRRCCNPRARAESMAGIEPSAMALSWNSSAPSLECAGSAQAVSLAWKWAPRSSVLVAKKLTVGKMIRYATQNATGVR